MKGSARIERQSGFTLLELMIVVLMIMILVAIAAPVYRIHVLHAKEAVLKEDLVTLRGAIDQYTQDKNKAPQSLEDLVSAGYMKSIPRGSRSPHLRRDGRRGVRPHPAVDADGNYGRAQRIERHQLRWNCVQHLVR